MLITYLVEEVKCSGDCNFKNTGFIETVLATLLSIQSKDNDVPTLIQGCADTIYNQIFTYLVELYKWSNMYFQECQLQLLETMLAKFIQRTMMLTHKQNRHIFSGGGQAFEDVL